MLMYKMNLLENLRNSVNWTAILIFLNTEDFFRNSYFFIKNIVPSVYINGLGVYKNIVLLIFGFMFQFDPEGFGEIPWPDFIQTLQNPDFKAQVPPHKQEVSLFMRNIN